MFWIGAYRTAGLKNLTGTPTVASVHPVQVISDASFDAVTVRVFATGLDYTIDQQGNVVSGTTREQRDYSEYWTLIRSVKRTGRPGFDVGCPHCGAPMQVDMAGHCTHCKVRICSGDFDWVLSRIEQDESCQG